MTVNTLKDVISDLILEHAELNMDRGNVFVANSDALAELILRRIREEYVISERGTVRNIKPTTDSWAGEVDRQGGSFSDQEIADSYTWR